MGCCASAKDTSIPTIKRTEQEILALREIDTKPPPAV